MEVFKLDNSKINEILYCMEDQGRDSAIDIITGEVIEVEAAEKLESNFYPLPKWTPVEGFRVMNDFVFHLKNPLLKEELTAILNSGSGVFKKFKNCLKSKPESQKLWYSYKKSQMREYIGLWYNQVREFFGLDQLTESEIDNPEDLLTFDFSVIKPEQNNLDFIVTGDKLGFNELYSRYPKDVIEDIYTQKRGDIDNSILDEDYIYIVKTIEGDSVGFIWGTGYTLGKSFDVMEILQLYVVPEFRGLGVSKMLLNSLLKRYREGSFKELIITCLDSSSWLINFLESEDLKITARELTFS